MNLILSLILYSSIDGYQLLERTRASKNDKSYYAYLQMTKNVVLERATIAADDGETSLIHCLEMNSRQGNRSFEVVRRDVEKLFYRIEGLAFHNGLNSACFIIDWAPF